MTRSPPRDPWSRLTARTSARIGLGRAGASLPTREVLSFALAHAQARDAVHAGVDWPALSERLGALGLAPIEVASAATERANYLRRPDLGRRLDDASRARLLTVPPDRAGGLVLVVGDGLSGKAVDSNAAAVIEALLPMTGKLSLGLPRIVLARGARVALGDEIGALLGAKLVAVIIGERPGLSAPDSLGIYLTYAPAVGCTDAQRNCISNVRSDGIQPDAAAAKLAWLMNAALAMRITGVGLKDNSEASLAQNNWVSPAG